MYPSRPMASHCIARTLLSATCHLSHAKSGLTIMRAVSLFLVKACLEFGSEGRSPRSARLYT